MTTHRTQLYGIILWHTTCTIHSPYDFSSFSSSTSQPLAHAQGNRDTQNKKFKAFAGHVPLISSFFHTLWQWVNSRSLKARTIAVAGVWALTAGRIVLAPIAAYSILQGWGYTAFIIIMLALITDMLDGAWARWAGVTSHWGSILDPVADKIFMACTMAALYTAGACSPLVCAIIVGRDIALCAVGLWFMHQKYPLLPPAWISKINTAVQLLFALMICTQKFWNTRAMDGLFLYRLGVPAGFWPLITSIVAYLVIALTLGSAALYALYAWRVVRHCRQP